MSLFVDIGTHFSWNAYLGVEILGHSLGVCSDLVETAGFQE